MKRGWVVVWRGQRPSAAYLTAKDEWSFDPDEGRIFRSWFSAKRRAVLCHDTTITRCWYDEEYV